MIRIHLGADDQRRIRFAQRPEPLWDTVLGVRALDRHRPVPPATRRWQRSARTRLHPGMKPLFSLFSPDGLCPDFLTPAVGDGSLTDSLKAVLEVPTEDLRDQLGRWLPAECRDGWARELGAGRSGRRRELATAVRHVHTAVIAPSTGWIERGFAADLAVRSDTLLAGGIDAMLASLHPDISWQPPVLTAHSGTDRQPLDVDPSGRGLLLYPSAFLAECLVVDVPGRTPVLYYPATGNRHADDDGPDDTSLADLLGRSRARVLNALTVAGSTTQLSRRAGTPLSSTSEHLRALRRAGLVESRRQGQAALHSLTPLGRRLLTQPTDEGARGPRY